MHVRVSLMRVYQTTSSSSSTRRQEETGKHRFAQDKQLSGLGFRV
jgi:hypothetical protein